MKTDESPSEAEKEEQKAEASTNTNGKQQERHAFWEKGNRDVYRTGHLRFFSSVLSSSSDWSLKKINPSFVYDKAWLF